MEIRNGRFGPYIAFEKTNYKIPKTVEHPEALTYEECQQIIAETPAKPAKGTKAAKTTAKTAKAPKAADASATPKRRTTARKSS